MMASHDTLVAMKTWNNNNMLTWGDGSRYFHNEFEKVQKIKYRELNKLYEYIIFIYRIYV